MLTNGVETRPAVAIRVDAELSLRTARALCETLETEMNAGAVEIVVDLRNVTTLDVVGLAALQQASEQATRCGVTLSIVADRSLHGRVLQAELLDELPFVTAAGFETTRTVDIAADSSALTDRTFVTSTPRLALRRPTWDELALFGQWANDPLLDQMVGSELLYQCRHLGAYHDKFVDLVMSDPVSLTLLVQPLEPARSPVGFVRLYDIHLAQQFAFLETAVATPESLRRGWGIEASRATLAYALDVLRLQRVEAKVYAYNVLSANSLKRNGFRPEGVLRQARQYAGQRWDILVFSILEDEMRQQRVGETFPDLGLWSGAC